MTWDTPPIFELKLNRSVILEGISNIRCCRCDNPEKEFAYLLMYELGTKIKAEVPELSNEIDKIIQTFGVI